MAVDSRVIQLLIKYRKLRETENKNMMSERHIGNAIMENVALMRIHLYTEIIADLMNIETNRKG